VNLSYSTKLENDIDQMVNEEYDSLDEDSAAELRSSGPEITDSGSDKALR